jgi:hypothetical protein
MCLSSLERKWWVSTFLASSKRGRPKPAVINNAAQGGLCKECTPRHLGIETVTGMDVK